MDPKSIQTLQEHLKRQTHVIKSSDGLVTLVFTGDGTFKSLKINRDSLFDVSPKEVEQAVLEVINNSKNLMNADMLQLMTSPEGQPFLDSFLKEDMFKPNDIDNTDDEEEDIRSDVS